MLFESFTQRLQNLVKKIRGESHLSDANMREILREIRIALLEADVALEVVDPLLQNLSQKLKGKEVQQGLTPEQMVVSVVRQELQTLFGEQVAPMNWAAVGPTVILMVGLQGSGKTTSAAKLAALLKRKNQKNPLLVATDIYRPAAIQQLQQLGEQINVPVCQLGTDHSVREIAQEALKVAARQGHDLIIFDTAGRLQIDEPLMLELADLSNYVHPHETLLVVDAMAGQEVTSVARTFHQRLKLTGAILTKVDSDTRGGAALSLYATVHIPIKWTGSGEKIDDLDAFYPDRMADRILGMGDIITMIEKAQEKLDQQKAERTMQRMMQGEFNLEDMLDQMEQMNRMGPLKGLLGMLPGMPKVNEADQERAMQAMKRTRSVIYSMTPEERKHPEIMRSTRKERVAKGSGLTLTDVNQVLRQYEKMKETIRQLGGMLKGGKLPKMPF